MEARRGAPRRVRRPVRRASATTRSWPPSASSPRRDGVFVEPASAAGVAGLLQDLAAGESYAGATVAITVTGHGLKDTATALEGFGRAGRHRRRRRRRAAAARRRAGLSHDDVRRRARSGSPSRPPRPTSAPGSTRSAWRSTCATGSRPRSSTRACVVEVDGRGRRARCRSTRPTSSSARCAPRFDAMGAQPPGLRLTCANAIPHARGLGSSSAAIVGGVGLARALVAGGALLLDDDALFGLAAEIEGHPDNVAPALLRRVRDLRPRRRRRLLRRAVSGVDPRISAVVFVPPAPVSTEVARGLLPAEVPHADAAANAGRAALLVAALAGQPEHLLARHPRPPAPGATGDRRCRSRWPWSTRCGPTACPAVVSGAGPTVLAFANGPSAPGHGRPAGPVPRRAGRRCTLGIDPHGAVAGDASRPVTRWYIDAAPCDVERATILPSDAVADLDRASPRRPVALTAAPAQRDAVTSRPAARHRRRSALIRGKDLT